jgi:hypothetical protein
MGVSVAVGGTGFEVVLCDSAVEVSGGICAAGVGVEADASGTELVT